MKLTTFLNLIQEQYPDNEIVMISFDLPATRGNAQNEKNRVKIQFEGTPIFWSAEYTPQANAIAVFGVGKTLHKIIQL